MATTTEISGTPQYADVGAHSTGGAIEAARAAVNAVIVETQRTVAAIEAEGQREITLEADAAREVAALKNAPEARMELAGAGGEVVGAGQRIDLSTDKGVGEMNKAIAGQAKGIDVQAKEMSIEPGVYRHAPPQGTKNLTGSQIETTGFALGGAGDESSAGVAPRGKGVVETGQNHSVIIGQTQAPVAAPALAPTLAAVPAGPGGMGGVSQGSTMVTQARLVQAPIEKVGQIMREDAARGGIPGDMSRSEYEGMKQREAVQNGTDIDRSQPVTPVSAAQHPGMLVADMTMAPKGPTWSGGEQMGTGEEGIG